jgi:hypothetical protein
MNSPPGLRLPRVVAEIERGIEQDWHSGAQIYASVHGEACADLAIGEARPGVRMTTSTIVEWASATRPITCVAAGILWQRGLLDLDDPVHRHLPEFAAAGKVAVTVRHLLTHTAGLTSTITDIAPARDLVPDICAAPLAAGWVPGERSAYNSVAMWVAELVPGSMADRSRTTNISERPSIVAWDSLLAPPTRRTATASMPRPAPSATAVAPGALPSPIRPTTWQPPFTGTAQRIPLPTRSDSPAS